MLARQMDVDILVTGHTHEFRVRQNACPIAFSAAQPLQRDGAMSLSAACESQQLSV